MAIYTCINCKHGYDERRSGIPFSELREFWNCPSCGNPKGGFISNPETMVYDKGKIDDVGLICASIALHPDGCTAALGVKGRTVVPGRYHEASTPSTVLRSEGGIVAGECAEDLRVMYPPEYSLNPLTKEVIDRETAELGGGQVRTEDLVYRIVSDIVYSLEGLTNGEQIDAYAVSFPDTYSEEGHTRVLNALERAGIGNPRYIPPSEAAVFETPLHLPAGENVLSIRYDGTGAEISLLKVEPARIYAYGRAAADTECITSSLPPMILEKLSRGLDIPLEALGSDTELVKWIGNDAEYILSRLEREEETRCTAKHSGEGIIYTVGRKDLLGMMNTNGWRVAHAAEKLLDEEEMKGYSIDRIAVYGREARFLDMDPLHYICPRAAYDIGSGHLRVARGALRWLCRNI